MQDGQLLLCSFLSPLNEFLSQILLHSLLLNGLKYLFNNLVGTHIRSSKSSHTRRTPLALFFF